MTTTTKPANRQTLPTPHVRIPCLNAKHDLCDGADGECDCTCHPHWRMCFA